MKKSRSVSSRRLVKKKSTVRSKQTEPVEEKSQPIAKLGEICEWIQGETHCIQEVIQDTFTPLTQAAKTMEAPMMAELESTMGRLLQDTKDQIEVRLKFHL